MRESKNISFKNYIYLSIILVLSIIVVVYFYMWYSEFEDNRISTPIMDQYFSVINYNELDTYLVENKDVIVYVSVLNNETIRNFEKKFGKVINKYSFNNNIIYLDLTDEYRDNKLYAIIKERYNSLDMPCIVIFKNGMVNDVYSIEDYDYDINLLISYLKIKEVIYD